MLINKNATCETCIRWGKQNYCGPCRKRIGHILWEPLPDIVVEEVEQIRFGRNNKVVYDKVRRVKSC